MQYTTSTTASHYPSRPPPHTTQALALASVQEATPTKHQETLGEPGIAQKSAHGVYCNTPEVISKSWWPSATTTTTTSILPSAHPFQESHGTSHSSIVTESPPALGRWQCVRLPSQSDSETGVVLHSLLLCPMGADIHWDFVQSHGGIEKVLKERWHPLKDLATHPALPSMTLVHPWLPWPITVHASGMDPRGVTVADVLLTISRNLMSPIDETGGRTRMSYLRRRQMFVGLKTSEIGGDIWELVVR